MKTLHRALLLLAMYGIATATPAFAQSKKRKQRDPRVAPAQSVPDASATDASAATPPDGCSYTGESTKRCLVSGNSAEIEVKLSTAHPVFLTMDEPIRVVTPKDDPYVAHQAKGEFVAYTLLSDQLPESQASIIRSETLTITVRFVKVASGADTQVHIVRSDRAKQDAEVERRVAAAEDELRGRYEKKYANLDAEAARLGRIHVVDEMQGGVSVAEPGGQTITRNDFVVLRVERVVRLGAERYLQISVQNRDRPTFHVGKVRAWVERDGKRTAVSVVLRCDQTAVRGRRRARCTLGLGLDGAPRKGDRLRVQVDSASRQRSVSLGGIDVR